ncbi:aminoglycoside phosphotransferase family protein [uncultured Microscilla sp.]|uniref:phosphotransferase enzyme family protein n=1 Tax=uncultured Microscilla sp. TaxID=432653 RepID=UPI002620BBFC|nr:aminoglycoside phosphotransferase family protein [uncultured Microscilla sp.]
MELASTPLVRKVAKVFALSGKLIDAQPFGNGHIHDTYRLETAKGPSKHTYILQRFNHQVFNRPALVMQNILRVTTHLQQQGCTTPTLVLTRQGEPYYTASDGFCWRVLTFIADTYTIEEVQNENQAYEAARCFGSFARQLSTLPLHQVHETIPRFHDLSHRYTQFTQALPQAFPERVEKAAEAIRLIEQRVTLRNQVAEVLPMLPLRVLHNDTKVNNVLLHNDTHQGVCAIDLDTVMPGYVLYDFGDMVRTFVSPVPEDARQLDGVIVRKHIFEALTKGYLQAWGAELQEVEKQSLWLGARLMPYMIGMRFLTDYLQGDVYYKTTYAGHNLDRAMNQLTLLTKLEVFLEL